MAEVGYLVVRQEVPCGSHRLYLADVYPLRMLSLLEYLARMKMLARWSASGRRDDFRFLGGHELYDL